MKRPHNSPRKYVLHTWKLLNVTRLVPLLLGLWRRVFDYFGMLKDDDVDGSLDKGHAHVCLEHYQNNLNFVFYMGQSYFLVDIKFPFILGFSTI